MAPSIPEPGDVVIRAEYRHGYPVYVLHVSTGPGQFLWRTREEAIASGSRFAHRYGVRLWISQDGVTFAVVEDFRAVDPVPDPKFAPHL
jgi:hypothetical protein